RARSGGRRGLGGFGWEVGVADLDVRPLQAPVVRVAEPRVALVVEVGDRLAAAVGVDALDGAGVEAGVLVRPEDAVGVLPAALEEDVRARPHGARRRLWGGCAPRVLEGLVVEAGEADE